MSAANEACSGAPRTRGPADQRTSGPADHRVNRVYRYGCVGPPSDVPLALQLIGQAHLYREDLRRVYNRTTRLFREIASEKDDSAHVAAYLFDQKRAGIRAARAARGHLLDAGTYWLVEASVEAAAKASGLDPFRSERWEETGRIGAAIQSVDQFPVVLPWTHKRVTLSEPNARRVAELTIRVGALGRADQRTSGLADQRAITWPVKLHRPLPEDAIVKQVAVQRVRVGHRFRWEVLVTVGMVVTERASDANAHGVVGVDVGWRREAEDKLRVATHDGADGIGVFYTDVMRSFDYADSVRSIRDENFDLAKEYVRRVGLPGAEHAHLWRDKDRMRRLARKTGDLGPVWWAHRDRHLEDIETTRTRAVRRRLDAYRRYADALARRYRYVALEDMPMSVWVGEADDKRRERQRSAASLGLLQKVIVERFGPDRVHWEPSVDTSRRCSVCGEVRSESVGKAPEWTCEACGVVHHQDENAGANLRAACERWIDGGNPPRARSRKPLKEKGKRRKDATGVGDERRIAVTPREPASEAAE